MSQTELLQYQAQVRAKQLELNKSAAQKILESISRDLRYREVSSVQISESKK